MNYDSLLTATDTNVINGSEYYRTGATLPDQGVPVAPAPYSAGTDDYIVGGLLLLFVFISTALSVGRDCLKRRLKGFFTTGRHYNDTAGEAISSEIYAVTVLTLTVPALLSVAYFEHINRILGFSEVYGVPYWLIGVMFVAFALVIYIKAWLYAIINWVFFTREPARRWASTYIYSTAFMAFILYPLTLCSVFTSVSGEKLTIYYLFAFILYEILLFYRLFVNFRVRPNAYLLLISYLCSVEIIPALAMMRFLILETDNFILQHIIY